MESSELRVFIDELLVNYRSAIRLIDDYASGDATKERAIEFLENHVAWVEKWKKEESQ